MSENCSELPDFRIKDRYYILNEVLLIQEDQCHEFKGHRNISIFDIPKNSFKLGEITRNSVSE